jgi:hypothetical protein
MKGKKQYVINLHCIPMPDADEKLNELYDKILLFSSKPEQNNILFDQPKDKI